MSTITTEFEVQEETLEAVPAEKPRRGRPPRSVGNPGESEADPNETAAMMRELATLTAKSTTELTMRLAGEQASKVLGEVAKERDALSTAIAALEERVREAEIAKQKTKIIGIKLGELPAKKLKFSMPQSMASLLAELIGQAKIGQAGGNWPMLVGPTGCGKTVLAELVAESLGLEFSHTNFTEGASETWVHGRQTPTGFVEGAFSNAFKTGKLFLGDELDACNDNVLLGMNTAMANGSYYNPISGETIKRHPNFVFIAACNTNGKGGTGAYSGRSRLDGATLNRFSMFAVDYNTELERELCPDKKLLEVLWTIRVKLTEKKSADVVSTRDIKNAYLQAQTGFATQRILDCLAMRMDAANRELFKAPAAAEKGGK